MDPSHPVVMDDGDLPWSDSHSMASDDSQDMAFPQSPPWMEAMSTGSVVSMSASISASSAGTSRLPLTGQLSPISTGMDIPPGPPTDSSACTSASGSSAAPTMVHSASSSVTDSWSIGGYGDLDSGSNDNGDSDMNDIHWEQGSDDVLTTLKDEPLDDDFRLEDIKEAPLTPVPSSNGPSSAQPKAKRPRGRPRKHPLTPIVPTNKVTKGRSKTGCITCRKRKKKCDEAKPRCMNCEKNAVVCEGYPEKQIWKSGKEKAEEERMKTSGPLPVITMQPIFNGLENTEDMIFWKHYNDHLSAVLTVEGEHKNAFKDMLIPLATKHQGLMHSILALSSKHIDFETPYGLNILKRTPSTSLEALQQRSDYHHEKAMEKLYADIARQDHADRDDPEYKTMLSARYGQMLCLLLESLAEGNPRGEHRVHLQAYQTLIQHSPPEDPAFLTFISEFFQYHIFADELIRYPDIQTARLASEDWVPIVPIHPPRLLGVADGLFNHLCQITSVRNTIRANMAAHVDPVVDYTSLYRAAEIDAAIRDWTPQWPPGDSRDRVGLLYKQMMWVYLFRTIYPPSSSTNQSSLSNSSTSLPMLPGSSVGIGSSMANTANTPPRSASNSCASSPSLRPSISHTDITNPRRHSIAIHAHTQTERADSPPPFRQPPNHDPRITLAVDESLTILDSFKPSDPTQTLLLIPCLVIGTACFSPAQQERVRTAVRTVRGYTGLRNTDRVAEVLEEVWRCMERGEWARVWDWQSVARSLGVDFLCT